MESARVLVATMQQANCETIDIGWLRCGRAPYYAVHHPIPVLLAPSPAETFSNYCN